jgi:hypothetical protein
VKKNFQAFLALGLVLPLMAGCAGSPAGSLAAKSSQASSKTAPATGPSSAQATAAASLIAKMGQLQMASISAHNADLSVAPGTKLSSATTARKVMALSGEGSGNGDVAATATAIISGGTTTGGAGNATSQEGPDASDNEVVTHDEPKHESDANGDDVETENFDVEDHDGAQSGHYSDKVTKDAKGKVIAGEVDFTGSDKQTEKTAFKVDAATGHLKLHVNEADGSNDDLDEVEDGNGNVETKGSVKLANGQQETVDLKSNKDNTATLTAHGEAGDVVINEKVDGSGTGEILDAKGTKTGDVVFGKDKKGQLKLTDGTKVDIHL